MIKTYLNYYIYIDWDDTLSIGGDITLLNGLSNIKSLDLLLLFAVVIVVDADTIDVPTDDVGVVVLVVSTMEVPNFEVWIGELLDDKGEDDVGDDDDEILILFPLSIIVELAAPVGVLDDEELVDFGWPIVPALLLLLAVVVVVDDDVDEDNNVVFDDGGGGVSGGGDDVAIFVVETPVSTEHDLGG